MKKPAKLLLCKETIRTLSGMQLTRVVAGDADTAVAGPPSDLKHCLAAAVVLVGR